MVLFDSIYSRLWYRLQKNNEVMVVVVVFQISWSTLSSLRGKKDFTAAEIENVLIV
jgi:hypothetical protein